MSRRREATEPTERYELIERIATGGMAEVFRAVARTASGHARPVAVKRLLPALSRDLGFVQMFVDEARLAMRLDHANIVHTYDAGTDGEAHYLVMELIDGLNLRGIMQRVVESGEPLTVPLACFIGIEVCHGLAYAHSRTLDDGKRLGIVHRDLSPPNVLLSRDGQVKITDFGLARALTHARVSRPGTVRGRYAYLAPEVLDGAPADQRADLFAVGVCLWEMLAGRRLFLGISEEDTIARVRRGEVPSLQGLRDDVSEELEGLIGSALEPVSGARVTTAREFGDRLARYLFEQGEQVTRADLAARVQGLLDAEPAPGAGAGLEALIARELDVLRGSHQGVQPGSGSEAPLDPRAFEEVDRARHDLGRFWDTLDDQGAQGSAAPSSEPRTPTVDSMESASSPMTLSTMLEGKLSVTEDSISLESYTVNEARASQSKLPWLILAAVVLGGAAYVFFGL